MLRLTLAAAIIAASSTAVLADGTIKLSGFAEAPATLVTTGRGTAKLKIRGNTVEYELNYSNLEGAVSQAHIHVGEKALTGGVSAFLCSNIGSPVPTVPCPTSGRVSGVIGAAQVIGPAAQGVEASNIADLIRAIRAGAIYVNVHTDKYPSGEIRGDG